MSIDKVDARMELLGSQTHNKDIDVWFACEGDTTSTAMSTFFRVFYKFPYGRSHVIFHNKHISGTATAVDLQVYFKVIYSS